MSLTRSPGKTGEEGTAAILGALCLFLSALEYLIPKPLPFLRIGLANAPLLLGLDMLSPAAFVLLVLVKVLGQGLISGTLFSYVFLFSLTGTALSAALMYGLRRVLGRERTGLTGISVLGALVSNASQIALARLFVFGREALLLLPPFLAAGVLSGAALGIFCETFISRSRWRRSRMPGDSSAQGIAAIRLRRIAPEFCPSAKLHAENHEELERKARFFRARPEKMRPEAGKKGRSRRERWDRLFAPGELCAAGLVMGLIFLMNPSTASRALQFAFFWFLAWASGRGGRPLITLGVMLGVALCNLAAPYGRVLAEWGPLRITAGSLEAGIRKALTLEGLLLLSSAAVRGTLPLPGPLGALIGESFRLLERLRERGLPRGGDPVLALDGLLLELEAGEAVEDRRAAAARGSRRGRLLLLGAAALTAALLLAP